MCDRRHLEVTCGIRLGLTFCLPVIYYFKTRLLDTGGESSINQRRDSVFSLELTCDTEITQGRGGLLV